MKPEYDVWAEALLQEIYYAPEDHRVSLIREHLLKAVQRGHTDALENGWWKEQDKSYNNMVATDKANLDALDKWQSEQEEIR